MIATMDFLCMKKSCTTCKIVPPVVKSRAVKNLNISYCKVNANDTSEEILHNKKKGKKMAAEKGATPLKMA